MRKLVKSLVGAALLLATLWSAASATAATAQYPDLKTLPPRLLRFDTVDVSGGDTTASGVHDVLRFSNTVWNGGPGEAGPQRRPREAGPARRARPGHPPRPGVSARVRRHRRVHRGQHRRGHVLPPVAQP